MNYSVIGFIFGQEKIMKLCRMIEFFMKNTKIVDFYIFIELL